MVSLRRHGRSDAVTDRPFRFRCPKERAGRACAAHMRADPDGFAGFPVWIPGSGPGTKPAAKDRPVRPSQRNRSRGQKQPNGALRGVTYYLTTRQLSAPRPILVLVLGFNPRITRGENLTSPRVTMSDSKPPPVQTTIETALASRTAEMLALPHMVCRRRGCRRRNACWWHFKANGEPCCLRNLTAEQRRLFDQVYDMARVARDQLGCCGLTFTSRRPWGGRWRMPVSRSPAAGLAHGTANAGTPPGGNGRRYCRRRGEVMRATEGT